MVLYPLAFCLKKKGAIKLNSVFFLEKTKCYHENGVENERKVETVCLIANECSRYMNALVYLLRATKTNAC